MQSACSRVDRRRRRLAVLLALSLVMSAGAGQVAAQQPFSYVMYVCKKLIPQNTGDVVYRECGSQFTTRDAYVGVVVNLRDVTEYTDVNIELLDPGQTVVWSRRGTLNPTPGRYWPSLFFWAVLPVAADIAAIGAENVALTGQVVKLEGKPANERLGEWVLKTTINRGVRQVKFTLQGAP